MFASPFPVAMCVYISVGQLTSSGCSCQTGIFSMNLHLHASHTIFCMTYIFSPPNVVWMGYYYHFAAAAAASHFYFRAC